VKNKFRQCEILLKQGEAKALFLS